MTFANPHLLWLLLVIPTALLAFFWWSGRARQRLLTQFIQARLLPVLTVGISTNRQRVRLCRRSTATFLKRCNVPRLIVAGASIKPSRLRRKRLPHGKGVWQKDMQVASLDHALWFHQDLRADDWLLYAMDSPWAGNSRGFSRGSVYNRAGQLVASVTQEGLIRHRKDWA